MAGENKKLQAGSTSKNAGVLAIALAEVQVRRDLMNTASIARYKGVIVATVLLVVALCMMGCSQSSSSSNEPKTNYTVVSVDKGTNPNDYFDFTSVDHSSVSSAAAPNSNIKDGVYSIGHLKDGNTVVWLSSDDTTGYDDCLFVYVEDELTNVTAVSWTAKLKETAIPYEEFEKSL